jgi:hypothetical protein
MDDSPDPSDVPAEVIGLIRGEATWQQLRDQWDRLYPDNPIAGEDDEEARNGHESEAT